MRLLWTHIVAGCVLAVGSARAEMQTWTSADGRTIEAEFVRLFGSSVTVKRANGMTASIPLTSLNEASREQATRLAGETKAVPVKEVSAQAAEAKPSTTPKPSTMLKLSTAKASGIPSEEEIKAFLTEYKETPSSEETYEFSASFSAPTLKPEEIKDLQRKKKVPYRLTVELCKTKQVDGKKKSVRLEGQSAFVVLNEAGDVIDRQRESLGKMCPS